MPPDLRAILEPAVRRLADAGVERSVMETQLLLALALGISRLDVLRGLDQAPGDSDLARFEQLVSQRAARVPLAYLRGTQEFHGLELEVTPAVLVPRPETELLVDLAIEKLADLPQAVLVDVGTGSGCIAIAAAVRLPRLRVIAVDLSDAALAVARRNAERHGVAGRVRLVQGCLLEPVAGRSAEMIVSNPPYIPSAEVAGLQPEVRDHEPRMALDGGADGFAFHRGVIAGALRVLRPGGWLALEVALGQAGDVAARLEAAGLRHVERRRDLAGVERAVVARRHRC